MGCGPQEEFRTCADIRISHSKKVTNTWDTISKQPTTKLKPKSTKPKQNGKPWSRKKSEPVWSVKRGVAGYRYSLNTSNSYSHAWSSSQQISTYLKDDKSTISKPIKDEMSRISQPVKNNKSRSQRILKPVKNNKATIVLQDGYYSEDIVSLIQHYYSLYLAVARDVAKIFLDLV